MAKGRTWAWVATLVAALPGVAGAEPPVPEGEPSCPIPGAPLESKNLDERLATVEGTVLTRRRLMRAVGEQTSTQDEGEYERSLYRKVRERAIELVYLKAAEREGLKIPPEVLDNAVRDRAQKLIEETSARTGRPVTIEELLANENMSWSEFRESFGNKIVIHHFFEMLWGRQGASGKRPRFDLEPSPADIRRLYQAHPEAVDVQPAAKIAFWFDRPVDHLDGGKRLYEDAVAFARRRLEGVLARVAAGASPKQAAEEASIVAWAAPERGLTRNDFVALERVGFAKPIKPVVDWALDPARKAREGRVFEGNHGVLIALAVTEVVPGRRRSFEDPAVQELLANHIRDVRRQRAMHQYLLRLLEHASIDPPALAEQIQAHAYGELKKLDSEVPFAREVWLR